MPDDRKKTVPFGILGLGRDPTIQTTIVTIVGVINYVILFYGISALGGRDENGAFHFAADIPVKYYLLTAGSVFVCIVGGALIQYPESNARWGARVLVGALPAVSLILIPFLWGR
ncbi:hypothetical protein [Roseibium sp.]|uniref:hypothetical protein n=1 Tax=Roseibium sp. TaxID=1936156 RepID=UPI003A982307